VDRIAVLVVLLALGLVVGVWRLRTDGRARATRPDWLAATDLGAELGPAATLVQFSTPICAPCRSAHRVLSAVAAATPGVRHVEVDAEQRLDLARRFGVVRTPTVLVLDAGGRVVRRSTGVPSAEQVRQALSATRAIVPDGPHD